MTARRRGRSSEQVRRRRGVAAVAGWLVILLAAFSLVTWRQTVGVEMDRALRRLEVERALAEGDRFDARRRIETLESRVRIVQVASNRLGMRLPEDSEIIFLPAVDGRATAQVVGETGGSIEAVP